MARSAVVVSTIGSALKERGVGVGELRRRLARRGITVSRGALTRLASGRAIKSVNFDLLLPILDELDLPLGSPFAVDDREHVEQQAAERQALNRQARDVARTLAAGRVTSRAGAEGLRVLAEGERARTLTEADTEDQVLVRRLRERLRLEHPEVFDRRGRLRTRALARTLADELGATRLSKEQVLSVIRQGRAARKRAAG